MKLARAFTGTTRRARRSFMFSIALAFFCAFLILAEAGGRAQQQQQRSPDTRARRVETKIKPTATPPVLAAPPPATATSAASPTPTPDPAGEEIDPNDIVTVDTNLVSLNVRVVDRNNRSQGDVRQDEFRVFEDGVPQKIEFISKEEVPISYGLAVDNSGSMRSQIEKVIEAGKIIINSNKPGDETFIVRFTSSDKIETVQDFTSNKNNLLDAIDNFIIESGQTAVIDAVYLSAERVAEYKRRDDTNNDRRRRALIVVTDGEDRDSFYKQEQLFARLREDDVQIYVIGFVNDLDAEGGLIKKSPKERAVNLLNRLAGETGGRAFFPNSVAELPAIAEEITRDLRTQYVVSYNPTNKAHDGSYRAVRVAVADASGRDKRIAITRPGYMAKRDGGTTVKPSNTRSNATTTTTTTTPVRPSNTINNGKRRNP